MNAERLHAIVGHLNREIEKSGTTGKLQELVNSLQRVVSQPHPNHQQALAQAIKTMASATSDSQSDGFSPTWNQIVQEIGGAGLLGKTLQTRIDGIFSRNSITPAVALEELQTLLSQLSTFKNALAQCLSAFKQFGLGDEQLSPGDCEIGILIPREAVQNSLLDFAEELKDLGQILNVFSEVATGKPDGLHIKTISSSELLVHLQANAPYAACLAVCIERIVALYKQLLEIRKLSGEIKKQGIPEEKTSGIEEYANNMMETGIEKIAIEVIGEFHKKDDKGRKNELTTHLKISLNRIANRIDQGFNLEVRIEPPQTDEEDKSTADKEKDAELNKAVETIQAAAPSMQFIRLEGKPILHLPESVKKHKKEDKES